MIFNMVGGGAGGAGGGATLVVSSPANVSVTVSKDDKSYTKNSGSLGSATFKGLATGTWTVVISNDGQTATKTIEITADYAITLAFFSATINITYPANSTCVVTNSGGQTVASDTNTDSSAKTWTATVGATGTYTITATATDGSGKNKSQSVEITSDGQSVNVTLSYQLLLYKAGTEYTNITGGWDISKKTGSPTLTKNSDNMTITIPAGADIAVATNSTIDFSGYSTLKIKFRRLEYKSNGYQYWGTTVYATQFIRDSYSAVANLSTAVDNIVSCDISTINNAQFAKLVISGLNTGGGTITTIIEEIWAE